MERDTQRPIELNALGAKVIDSIIANPMAAKTILEPIWIDPQAEATTPPPDILKKLDTFDPDKYRELANYIGFIVRDTELYSIVYDTIDDKYPTVMANYEGKIPEQAARAEEIAKNIKPGLDKEKLKTHSNRAFMLIQLADFALNNTLSQQNTTADFPRVS